MFKLLLLLFITIPFLEIWLLIQSGQHLGVFNTLLLLVVIAWVGATLVKREGARTLIAVQSRLERGEMPGDELLDGALLLVAGVLMVTPGYFSDVVGLLLALPLTRPWFRNRLKGILAKRMTVTSGQDPQRTIIEGEYHREPEEGPRIP